MKVSVVRSELERVDLPIVVVGFTEENIQDPGSKTLKDLTTNLVELGDFKGEIKKFTLLYPSEIKSRRLLLAGLGKEQELDIENIRKVAGSMARQVRDLGVDHIGVSLPSFTVGKLKKENVAEALV